MYPVCQFAYFSAATRDTGSCGQTCRSAGLPGFEQKCFVSGHSIGWTPVGIWRTVRERNIFWLLFYFVLPFFFFLKITTNHESICSTQNLNKGKEALGIIFERSWQARRKKIFATAVKRTYLFGWIDILSSTKSLHLIQPLCFVAQNMVCPYHTCQPSCSEPSSTSTV